MAANIRRRVHGDDHPETAEAWQFLGTASLLAGARAVVTSLWEVDDEATRALMIEFYKNHWHRGLGKLEALRKAQRAMLHGELYMPPGTRPDEGKSESSDGVTLPPRYWAAFALSGDWQ